MGVPFYFRLISRRFPDCVVTLPQLPDGPITCLYLDFNCVIHQCAADELYRASLSAGSEPPPSDQSIIQCVLQGLWRIERSILPQHLVVAMDGVPPLCKVVQQRKRRFMNFIPTETGGARNDHDGGGSNQQSSSSTTTRHRMWDTNAISPGTAFMRDLADAVRLSYPQALVLDTSEPGEGEQKIMHLLSNLVEEDHNEEEVHVVYGTDADLIQLCLLQCPYSPMSSSHHKLFVMRPHHHRGGPTVPLLPRHSIFVSINRLSRHLGMHSRQEALDHVLMLSLFGNDFVPGLPCLHLDHRDFDLVLRSAYRTLTPGSQASALGHSSLHLVDVSPSQPPSTATVTVVWPLLLQVLEELAAHERDCMQRRHDAFVRHFPADDSCAGGSPSRRSLDPRFPGWRTHFYELATTAGTGTNSAPQWMRATVHAMCQAFLSSLQWMLNYYARPLCPTMSSSTFFYPFPYGPLLGDLVSFMHTTMHSSPTPPLPAAPNSSLTADMLLAIVLPPRSAHLLPDPEWRRLHHDLTLGCVHMYPSKFPIITYLKFVPWAREPILPPVDVPAVKRAIFALNGVASRFDIPCTQFVQCSRRCSAPPAQQSHEDRARIIDPNPPHDQDMTDMTRSRYDQPAEAAPSSPPKHIANTLPPKSPCC